MAEHDDAEIARKKGREALVQAGYTVKRQWKGDKIFVQSVNSYAIRGC